MYTFAKKLPSAPRPEQGASAHSWLKFSRTAADGWLTKLDLPPAKSRFLPTILTAVTNMANAYLVPLLKGKCAASARCEAMILQSCPAAPWRPGLCSKAR